MLNDRLVYLREKIGLNQTQASIKLDISRVNYNRYEKGDRTPDNETLKRIATFYSVTIDYLLENDDRSINPTQPKEDNNSKSSIIDEWPEASEALAKASEALRRCGRKPTEAERRRIAKIIELAVDIPDDED